MAYDAISPIGERRSDINAADIQHAIAIFSGKASSTAEWSDFYRDYWKPVEEALREEDPYMVAAKMHTFFCTLKAFSQKQRQTD